MADTTGDTETIPAKTKLGTGVPLLGKGQVALNDKIACFILYILSPKLANKVMFLACPRTHTSARVFQAG